MAAKTAAPSELPETVEMANTCLENVAPPALSETERSSRWASTLAVKKAAGWHHPRLRR
jgi:hypothetical protein